MKLDSKIEGGESVAPSAWPLPLALLAALLLVSELWGWLLSIDRVQALAGTFSFYGIWFEGGRLLLGRRAGSSLVRWGVGPALAMVVSGLLATGFAALGQLHLYLGLCLLGGIGLTGLSIWRCFRRQTEASTRVSRESLVVVALALLVGAAAVYMAFPAFIVDDGQMLLTDYYVLDGLWFSGSAAAFVQGFPLADYRLAGTQLNYHFLSLALGGTTSELFQARCGSAFYYVLVPVWYGLSGLLACDIFKRLIGGRRARLGWLVLAVLSGTFLCDSSSLLLLLGQDAPAGTSLWDFLNSPAPTGLLGNLTRGRQDINPPQALSLVTGLAAVRLWLGRPDRFVGKVTAVWVGVLILGTGLAKGVAVPLILPSVLAAFGLLVIARFRGGTQTLRARRETSTSLSSVGIVLCFTLLALVILMMLQGGSEYGRLAIDPWYQVDYQANAFRILSRWADVLPLDSRPSVFALWLLPGLSWLLLAMVPLPGVRTKGVQAALWLSQLAGLTAANVFAFVHFSGSNEIYFSSWTLGILSPFAVAGLHRVVVKRRYVRAGVGAVLFAIGLFGALHLLVSKRVLGGVPIERRVGRDQLDVLDWLRQETPQDATVLYFRYTTLDGDPRRLSIPLNESYYLVSGLAERQSVSEGSLYGSLYLRPGFAERRANIQRFYSASMTEAEASQFLEGVGVDLVLGERGINLQSYENLLLPVYIAPIYQVYAVIRE